MRKKDRIKRAQKQLVLRTDGYPNMFLSYMRSKIIIKTLRDSTLLTSFKRFSLSYNKKHILFVSHIFFTTSLAFVFIVRHTR